jgi:LacI family gluconate utilization system Gnt-I transcriptional repressor
LSTKQYQLHSQYRLPDTASDTYGMKKYKVRKDHLSKPKAPTLIDVAKVAGVSPITVSRALNQPDMVSEEAREKVRLAVEKTGYLPNMLAGSLATRTSRLVALIVPTVANPIFAETVRAISDTLANAGYQALLGISGYAKEQEQDLLEAILCRRPDGVILTGMDHTEISRTRLAAAKIPIVETWDLGGEPIDTLVGFSHYDVGMAVGEYLLGKGYKKFASVSADDQRAEKRREGFMDALKQQGITDVPTSIVETPAKFSRGREAFAQLLDTGISCDAVYCSSDTLAHGVITEARSRNLAIPQDIAVMGFGDLDFASHALPSISSVKINGAEIGRLAVESLLAEMLPDKAPTKSQPVIDVGFSIAERQSA